ncbi:MAG: peptide chain release factor N(5)-glutamine methyltransferase [Leptolyngbyaceae cyanobacterium]
MAAFPHRLSGPELWAWRSQAQAQARAYQIDPAEVDWYLQGLCEVTPLDLRLGTLAQQSFVPAQVSWSDFQSRWQQRVRDRVPIQHLVGQTTWRNLTLTVSPDVLIPRPETELIIDLVVSQLHHSPQGSADRQGVWADLGTGSGAIALGLAQALPQATILAVDISESALAIARQNAAAHGLSSRIQFLQGSWFEPLPRQAQLAGLVSNPPYIPQAVVSTLAPEVAAHEPHIALDGGADGLEALRHLAQRGPDHLQPGGLWLVELMQGQAAAVMDLLHATQAYEHGQIVRDLAGIERFVLTHRRG